MERKIYSGWAFSENESEKSKINESIYDELKQKVVIHQQYSKISEDEMENIKKEKTVIQYEGKGCYHNIYKILSNPHDLTNDEIALVADKGNLCFGYRKENGLILVHTD